MSRQLQVFQVFYRLRSDKSIRSLVSDGVDLNDIQYEKSYFITSYR